MKELLSITRKLAYSPWTYLYWAVSAAGIVCAHLNTGLSGSPALGAASIAATIISLALFYFHLNKLRNELAFPTSRTAIGLFFSIYAFRLRLLLTFAPLIGYIFWEGTFGRLATEYLIVATASPEQKFGELVKMLSHFWLLVLTVAAFGFFDIAGRSRVIAQGNEKAILRKMPAALRQISLPLTAFAIAHFALALTGEYLSFLDYVKLTERITLALAGACLIEPISYGLNMVTVFYLAGQLKQPTPNNP